MTPKHNFKYFTYTFTHVHVHLFIYAFLLEAHSQQIFSDHFGLGLCALQINFIFKSLTKIK
jgi:hypothetical protein